MKRVFQTIGILTAVLSGIFVVALIGGLIFLKSFDIGKYKPQIIQAASRSLGRPVDFNEIDLAVSLKKGIRLRVTDLSVAENPDFGKEPFIAVKEVEAGVDIVPFVLSRRISVPNIVLRSPRIAVIRNRDGSLNVQTIGKTPVPEAAPGTAASPSSAAALPAVFIDSFRIEDAQIILTDKFLAPGPKPAITGIVLDVRRFSLHEPFDVLLEAAVLAPRKNFSWAGTAQLQLNNKEAKISNTQITLDLKDIPLAEVRALMTEDTIPFPRLLEGQVKLDIKEAVLSEKGLGRYRASLFLNNGKISIPDAVPGISVEADHIGFEARDLSSDISAAARIFLKAAVYQERENIDLAGALSVDAGTKTMRLAGGRFKTDLALWPVEKMKKEIAPLKDIPMPGSMSGAVSVDIKDMAVSPAGIQSLLLDIRLQDGAVQLNDSIPGASLEAGKTDLVIEDFSLDKPFAVSLKTACFSRSQSIAFEGAVSLDLKEQSAAIKDGRAHIDLDALSPDLIKASGLVPAETVFPQELAGKIEITGGQCVISPKGVDSLKFDLQWKNGKIRVDEAAPGISFAAQNIDFDIRDFSLEDPFRIAGNLGYENAEDTIFIDGNMAYDPGGGNVRLHDTAVKVDLAGIPLAQVKTKLQPLKDVSLPESLKGRLEMNIQELAAGPKGIIALSGSGSLKDWEVKMKELAVPAAGAQINFTMTEKKFSADEFPAALGAGRITAGGSAVDYMTDLSFNFSGQVKGLDLAEILDQKDAKVKVEGLVSAGIKAAGRARDINSIAGEGDLEITEAKLKDFNLLKTVLDNISFLPGVVSRIKSKIPEEYRAELESSDTKIRKISGPYAISQGNISMDSVSLEADAFSFAGKGKAGFDQSYALDGAFKVSIGLSEAIGGEVNEFEYLYDENSRISLPVHMAGKGSAAPSIAVTQTAVDIGKNALRNQGKVQLEKVLNKVLGTDGQGSVSAPESGNNGAASQEKKSGGSTLIDGVVGAIFK